MATHNIANSTRGMDASIQFAEEQAQPKVCYQLTLTFSVRKTNESFQSAAKNSVNLHATRLFGYVDAFPIDWAEQGAWT